MAKIRVEIHLTEEIVAKLDELAAKHGRSRKNFCETQIQSIVAAKPQVQDLTKSNVAVEPPKQATSNYAINSDGNEKSRKEQILAEIEAINAETKPSMMAKSTYEFGKKKRLEKLEVELAKID